MHRQALLMYSMIVGIVLMLSFGYSTLRKQSHTLGENEFKVEVVTLYPSSALGKVVAQGNDEKLDIPNEVYFDFGRDYAYEEKNLTKEEIKALDKKEAIGQRSPLQDLKEGDIMVVKIPEYQLDVKDSERLFDFRGVEYITTIPFLADLLF